MATVRPRGAGAPPRRALLPCALVALLFAGTAEAQRPAPAPRALPDLEVRPARPAWMGVRAAPGVQIVEVVPGGPAEKAGLKSGDLITAVDGRSTVEEPGLMGALSETKAGDRLEFDVMRAGEELQIEIVLGEFPLDLWTERVAAWEKEKAEKAGRPPEPGLPAPPPVPEAPGADLRYLGVEERPFLGVRLQELNAGLAAYFGLPAGSPGVLVEHVHEDGPAASAGMTAGDILLAIDERELENMTALGDHLRSREVGDSVALSWWRGGSKRTGRAVLAARQKDIWVISPPDAERLRERARVREQLEARLRLLEEQNRRLAAERAAVLRSIEELVAESRPRAAAPKPKR